MKGEDLKAFCKDLGLTYKELGQKLGYSQSAINIAVRTEKISTPLKKACELYSKNLKLENELKDFRTLKEILKK